MREAAADERFEDAARYRNRLLRDREARRAAGGRPARDRLDRRDRRRRRGRPRRGAGLPAPRRQDDRPARLPPRERRGPGRDDDPRGVLPRVLRERALDPAADRRAARGDRARGARAVPRPSCAARASRCARRRAARSGGSPSWRRRTPGSRSTPRRSSSEQKRLRRVAALEELREALNLESLPLRIECYDISNIQGQQIVGSMVVFQDAIAEEGALPQVRGARARRPGRLRRDGRGRLAPLRAPRAPASRHEYDEGFATAPNLVVIDGGKGQLSAALAAMQAYELPRVAVIALAKRVEEVFVPGRSDPILLDPHSAGLQLLQRIRDEAHRFALDFHRQRRSAQARESLFDTLEGVGPVRRRALLQHFGSTEARAGGERRRSSRASPACRPRRRARSTRSCTRPDGAGSATGPVRTGPVRLLDRGRESGRLQAILRVADPRAAAPRPARTDQRVGRGSERAGDRAPVGVAEREEERREAEDHVHRDQRQLHPDAEREQRRRGRRRCPRRRRR